MSPVSVVSDTTHSMPREVVEASGAKQISLYVSDASGEHREADITDLDAFYGRMREGGSLPTTSQPSVGDFLAVYEPLVAQGDDVVSLHISGELSGTLASARQAAAEIAGRGPGPRIEVLDSGAACAQLGLVVLAAAGAARAGQGLDEVAARAREACDQTRMRWALDSLEHLRRGGRIGAGQAWVGGALKIKPILTIDGTIKPVARVRTWGRAVEHLTDYMRTRSDEGADGWVVQHIQVPDQAAQLVERGREIFGSEPLFVSEVGPVTGTHLGPGMLGVCSTPSALLR
jgi:DegV family protein with EDD domain